MAGKLNSACGKGPIHNWQDAAMDVLEHGLHAQDDRLEDTALTHNRQSGTTHTR
jgi:hypothetical protein